MLIQFSVENYLSFNEEQVFSLLATNDSLHRSHLIPDVPHKGESVLRAAAIYGANGAGKSNLVKAMEFAKNLILTGTRGSQSIVLRPFKLAKETGKPSKFEFIFRTNNITYNYGFRLDSGRIWEEWLFATPKTQEVLLFQRTTDKSGTVSVEFGPSFTGRKSKDKQFLEFVAQGTRPNQLFLSEALERNVPEVKPILNWFSSVLLIIPAEAHAIDLVAAMHQSSASDILSGWLKAAGTGIDHLHTKEMPFDSDSIAQELPSQVRDNFLQEITTLTKTEMLDFSVPDLGHFSLTKNNNGQTVQIQLKMQHRTSDGRFVTFDMDEESDGTQRLIHLLPAVLMLKANTERVVFIDELDRRFHTLVSRFLIETALSDDSDQKNNQLIFTTHDTNLLDLELLRRDEIWFAEKDAGGASHLYSLSDFKVRTDLKVEKGYLAGRFGAIPFSVDKLSQDHAENAA